MSITSVDSHVSNFECIYICTDLDFDRMMDELDSLDLGQLIYDSDDYAINVMDPFNFSRIQYN